MHKGEGFVPMQMSIQTSTLQELKQVGAATHRHVLAIVDRFISSRIRERAGTSTGDASRLQDGDLRIGTGVLGTGVLGTGVLGTGVTRDRFGRRHAGQTTADDDHVPL